MKKVVVCLFVFILACLLVGCKTKTVYVPVESVKTTERIVKDTLVQVKLEKEYLAQTVKDTVSVLENSYAKSTARWTNGFLYHDLASKPVKVSTDFRYVVTHVVDSIRVPFPVETIKLKEVKLPMAWWQKSFFYLGILCFVGGVAALGIKIRG